MDTKHRTAAAPDLWAELNELSANAEDLVLKAATAPLEVMALCRASVENTRMASRQLLTLQLGLTYASALAIRDDETGWAEFLTKPYWANRREKPDVKDRPRAIRFTLRHNFGPSRGRKYAPALEYLERHGVGPTEAISVIRRAGDPTKLVKLVRQGGPLPKEGGPSEEDVSSAAKSVSGEGKKRQRTSVPRLDRGDAKKGTSLARQSTSSQTRASSGKKKLEVELGPKRMSRAMSMERGDIANAAIERRSRRGQGPDRFVITLLQRLTRPPKR